MSPRLPDSEARVLWAGDTCSYSQNAPREQGPAALGSLHGSVHVCWEGPGFRAQLTHRALERGGGGLLGEEGRQGGQRGHWEGFAGHRAAHPEQRQPLQSPSGEAGMPTVYPASLLLRPGQPLTGPPLLPGVNLQGLGCGYLSYFTKAALLEPKKRR